MRFNYHVQTASKENGRRGGWADFLPFSFFREFKIALGQFANRAHKTAKIPIQLRLTRY